MKNFFGIVFLCIFSVLAALLFIKTQTDESFEKKYTIGILPWIFDDYRENIQGFREQIFEQGFMEGKDVEFVLKDAQGDLGQQKEMVRDLIAMDVDLIYSLTASGTEVVHQMTSDIPVVFSMVIYPVESGLIDSLNNSKNNLVGVRNYVSPSQQYFSFERIFPDSRVLAFIRHKNDPDSLVQFKEFQNFLNPRKIKILDIAVSSLFDMEKKIRKISDQIDAFYIACDSFMERKGYSKAILLSRKYQKPTFSCSLKAVKEGAVVGHITKPYDVGKIAGKQASWILKGADPSWLQTESPGETHVLINSEAAKATGVIQEVIFGQL